MTPKCQKHDCEKVFHAFPSGGYHVCHECRKETKKRYRERHPDRHLGGTQRWRKENTGAHRLSQAKAKLRWRANHPGKHQAHMAVAYALRTGRLLSPARCFRCESIVRVEYHHHCGYAPENHLRVIAICKTCHPTEPVS